MANTVQRRLDRMPEYQPGNLDLFGRKLVGYGTEPVLP